MKIALIGDSIRMGYAPWVAEMMPEQEFFSPHENGGDSANLRAHWEEWFAGLGPALIHFNCGLHDLRYNPENQTHQVELPQYRENLTALAHQLVASPHLTPVWVSTTPVIEERANIPGASFYRFNHDVAAYNAAAREIMDTAGIPIHDLHGKVSAAFGEEMFQDAVHYTEEGQRQMAAMIVDCLRDLLESGS